MSPTTSQWYAQSRRQSDRLALGAPPDRAWCCSRTPTSRTSTRTCATRTSSAHECPATGTYVAGGKEIQGRSVSYDAAANEYNLLGNDLSWGPGATISTRYGAVYEMATADKWLWAILDFGALINVSNGVFQIDWAAGLLSIQAGPPV